MVTNRVIVLQELAKGNYDQDEQREIKKAINSPQYRKLMNSRFTSGQQVNGFIDRFTG